MSKKQTPEEKKKVQQQQIERAEGKGPVFKGPVTEQRLTDRGFDPQASKELVEAKGFAESQKPVSQDELMSRALTEKAAARTEALNPPQEDKTFMGFKKEEGKGLLGGDYATGRNLAVAAGYGVAIGTAIIGGWSLLGSRAVATRGLSSRSVMQAAKGILKKKDVLGTPIKTRIATTGGKFKTQVKIPINTVYANKAVQALSQMTSLMKNPLLAMGVASSAIGLYGLGEWGRAEGIEGLSFAYDSAVKSGNEQLAEEIREALDPDWLDHLMRIFPLTNAYAGIALKNLGSRIKRKQTDFEEAQLASKF